MRFLIDRGGDLVVGQDSSGSPSNNRLAFCSHVSRETPSAFGMLLTNGLFSIADTRATESHSEKHTCPSAVGHVWETSGGNACQPSTNLGDPGIRFYGILLSKESMTCNYCICQLSHSQ
eukprot:scaffold9435_cov137-Cylindrotheca_fusiformis.AAC.4